MDLPILKAEVILPIVEAAAVLVSAIAGMIVASQKKMDVVGAFALACVNAFGGGTVRDLLLDNRPFYWMKNWEMLVAILAISIAFVYNARIYAFASEVHRRSGKVDALGLALFTVAGVGIALTLGAPIIVATLMGVVTGTMGGVLRDLVVNEIPDMFRPGGLYATASFAGGLAFIASLEHGLRYSYATAIGIAVVTLFRLASMHHGVSIPAPQWAEDSRAEGQGKDPPGNPLP